MQSFSQYWFFHSKSMVYPSICLCHLWFLSSVSYSFLHTGLLSLSVQFSSVQLLSHVCLCSPMDCSMPDLLIHHQHAHWVSDAIQPSHPLSSPSPPAFNLSQHQGLFKESALCIRWPKYWRFSFNISPSNEYSGLVSFRMDWLDLLSVPETLKSLLQHHSSKASVLQCSVFYMVQLSHS